MGKASKTVKNKKPKKVQPKKEHIDWKTRCEHKPLKGRTTDPDALDLDTAHGFFESGVALARMGRLGVATKFIARAYLMDPRAIKWMASLPPGEEEEASKMVLDWVLMDQLMKANVDPMYTHIMGLIILRFQVGGQRDGKIVLRDTGLLLAQEALDRLETHPAMKFNPDYFGEGFNRPRLLLETAQILIFLAEFDEAAEYLAHALEIDPDYLPARKEQAALWGLMETKDDAEVFAENKELMELLHEDSPWLSPVYARLAIKTLKNPKLGTVKEAEQYFDKCLGSIKRRKELYANIDMGDGAILDECRKQFWVYWNGPEQRRKVREGLDAAVQATRATNKDGSEADATIPAKDKPSLHNCLKCGTTEDDVEKVLLTCGGCGKVAYCSRKCQLADWGDHKKFCKMHNKIRKKSRNDTKAREESTAKKGQDTVDKGATQTPEPGHGNQVGKADIPAETDSDFVGLD